MSQSITRDDLDKVLSDLTLMHYRIGKLGLWKTFQAMHEIIRVSGFEVAKIIEGKHPTKLIDDTVSNDERMKP